MAKQVSKTEQTTNNKSSINKGDIVLSVILTAEDSDGKIVDINQSVVLPSIKEPMFLPDAYTQVDQMMNIIALEPFKRMLKTYFNKALKDYNETVFVPDTDIKIIAETAKVDAEDIGTDPLNELEKEGLIKDTSDLKPEEHFNLELEEDIK